MKEICEPIDKIVPTLPLFRELDGEHLKAIVANTRKFQVAKGEMLFQKGDEAKGFYFVLKGQIKLAFPSLQGNEKVVAIFGPGQSFGEAAMFLHQPFPVRAESLTNAEFLLFSSSLIFSLLEKDPMFARKLLAGLSLRLHQLVMDVELYSQRSSVQRLIGYFLQLSPELDCDASEITVDLPSAKQVIASRLNLTPETLSRILHELSQQKLIEMNGRRIHIPDPGALRAYDM